MTWFLGAVKGVFAGLWGYVAAAGAALVAILTIYQSGKKSGVNEVVVKTKEKEVENVRKADKAERKNAARSTSAKRELLRKWTRK